MRIGIDAREIQDGVFTGIGHPLYDFLKYFSSLDNEDDCIIFSVNKVPIDFGSRVKNVLLPKRFTFWWDQVTLPRALGREEVDLFYSPYYKIPLWKPCFTVSAILDLMYLVYPQYRRNLGILGRLYYATIGRLMAHRADFIWTCSQYSKLDIIRIYGIKDDKIEVIPLSISDHYKPTDDFAEIEKVKKKFNTGDKYLLYMGNFKSHKNVNRIILSFAELVKDYTDLSLVLGGPKSHDYEELKDLVKEHHLEDRVKFIGKITKDDQPQLLYAGAEVFIFPSFYEGFGIPPAEAMACRTPVVASEHTSIPEVVKDAGILINPNKVEEITRGVRKILTEEKFKKSLIDKGTEYVKELNDVLISKKTYEYFQRVYESQKGTA